VVAVGLELSMLPEPGTGWVVAEGDRHHWSWECGGNRWRGGPIVDDTTWFDLASLTKVLITVPLTLRAMKEGAIEPETRLGRVGGRLAEAPVGRATVEQLLTHTSGAPPELEVVGELDDSLAALVMVDPGSVVYSDAGFIALGRLLELVSGKVLHVLAREFAAEMGIGRDDIEFFEVEPGRWASTGPRLRGKVHDPAARSAGRLLGHSGCFTTLTGARRLLDFWLAPVPCYSALAASALRPRGEPRTGGHRGWGWALQGDDYACVPGWPAATVSHTGFTGTAVAFDPDGGTFALVLSNAVADGSGASLRWLRSMFASLAPSVNPSGRDGTV